MNRKERKLSFIRSKNNMKSKGYIPPKWILENNSWPTKWKNTKPSLFEESWIIDMVKR